MKRLSTVWQLLKNEHGFFLLDILIGLCIAAVLGIMICTATGRLRQNWEIINRQNDFRDTGRYILGMLEKELGYESVAVDIYREVDGDMAIRCKNHCGNKTVSFLRKGNYLYKKTITGKGIGTNPLYIKNFYLGNWQVIKVSEKQLLISFFLEKKRENYFFCQLFYCSNGVVNYDDE